MEWTRTERKRSEGSSKSEMPTVLTVKKSVKNGVPARPLQSSSKDRATVLSNQTQVSEEILKSIALLVGRLCRSLKGPAGGR